MARHTAANMKTDINAPLPSASLAVRLDIKHCANIKYVP